jgi:hypothetical protein
MAGRYNALHADYLNRKTGSAIILTESADKFEEVAGRSVTQNGFRGRIAKYQKPFPYVKLFWESDCVYFSLSASCLSEEEAVKMATSMRLVN